MILPTRLPIWTLLALFVGLALTSLTWFGWYRLIANPAQRFYLGAYVRSSLPSMPRLKGGVATIVVTGPEGYRSTYRKAEFSAWLDRSVYRNGEAFQPAIYVSGVLLFVCCCFGARKDQERRKRLFVDGVPVRGTRFLGWRQWNRKRKGDGFQLGLT